jgi:hypothetical protein
MYGFEIMLCCRVLPLRVNKFDRLTLSKSPFFENYETFLLAPSRFPDGEKKEGRRFGVHNPPRPA